MSKRAEKNQNQGTALPVVELALSKLRPAPYNPQRMTAVELKGLARSIQDYGFLEPIVVNERCGTDWPKKDRGLVIVGGHNRVKALRSLGRDVGPCTIVRLKPGEEKVLNLALNNHGDYDPVALAPLLAELQGLGIDIEPIGMPDELIAHVLNIAPGEAAAREEERVPPLPAKPKTKRGDILTLGLHRLMCGDATSEADAGTLLQAGGQVDAILSDPPYGANIDNNWSRNVKHRHLRLGSLGFSPKVGTNYEATIGDDVLFDPAALFSLYGKPREMFLFGADYYSQRIPAREKGSWLVWDKRSPGADRFMGSEFELIWTKRKHRRLVLRHLWHGLASGKEGRGRLHANQKPTALLREILTRWTKRGDVVVDPYAGSGSTLIACEQTSRVCLAMEIDPRYCDVIRARYEAFVAERGKAA